MLRCRLQDIYDALTCSERCYHVFIPLRRTYPMKIVRLRVGAISDVAEIFKISRFTFFLKMIYGRATGPGFSNCIFSVFNIFSEFQKSVKGLLLARSGNQKSSKNMQFRPRTVNFSPDWVTNS